ncbi:unnamed protein product [Closterium sp. Naga37s-1]|nr:unnamed protein product [Closterium sp. Naga37s-1]
MCPIYVHSQNVSPLLQFTRRAGQSLRHRLHQLAAAIEAHRSNNAQLCTDVSTGAAARPSSGSAAAVAAVSAAAVAAVRISTFHSFCLQTLRQFAHLAGLPKDFTVFPPKMQAETLMELLQEWAERKAAEAGEREGEHGASRISVPSGKKLHFIIRRFLHEFGRLEAENAAMQVLQGSRPLHQPAAAAATSSPASNSAPGAAASGASGRAAAVNHGGVQRRRRVSFGGDGGGGGGEGDEDGGLFAWLWEQYRRRLVLNKAVDFSQFAPKAVKLLHAHPEILASSSVSSSSSSREHVVDEFQDTDSCQMELLLLLCRPLPSVPTLTLVADDDQQIYSFRGAMGLPNLRRFLRTYPQARTVCLDQNFRSCGSVVEAARHVIAHNQWRHAKWMVTAAPVGPLVSLCECRTDRCEAAAVVGKICHLVGSCGVPANQIAILYRVQAVGKVIRQYLKSHGIKVSSAATGGGGAGGFGGGGGGGGGGTAGGGEWGAAEEDGVAVAANGFIAEGGNSATAGTRGGRGTGTVGAVFHDILALLRLAANESDDVACRQVLRFVCPPPTRKVAVCLRTLQCAPHRISLLPAARMTRLHLLGISRCAALSNVSSTDPGGACNRSAGNSSAYNGSHSTHAHNAAEPAWPHTLSPDDTEVLEGIRKMAAAVSELQGLLGIPPPGWSSPPAPASSAPDSASRHPACRRRGSAAGIMGLGGGPTSFPAFFQGGGGEEGEDDGVSCEALVRCALRFVRTVRGGEGRSGAGVGAEVVVQGVLGGAGGGGVVGTVGGGRGGGGTGGGWAGGRGMGGQGGGASALDPAMFAGVRALLLEAAAFDRERRHTRQAMQARVTSAAAEVASAAGAAAGGQAAGGAALRKAGEGAEAVGGMGLGDLPGRVVSGCDAGSERNNSGNGNSSSGISSSRHMANPGGYFSPATTPVKDRYSPGGSSESKQGGRRPSYADLLLQREGVVGVVGGTGMAQAMGLARWSNAAGAIAARQMDLERRMGKQGEVASNDPGAGAGAGGYTRSDGNDGEKGNDERELEREEDGEEAEEEVVVQFVDRVMERVHERELGVGVEEGLGGVGDGAGERESAGGRLGRRAGRGGEGKGRGSGGSGGRESEQDSGGVVLSTIHQAKGLEWQAVIVVRANEGVLPLVDFSRVTQAPATATATNYSPTPQTLPPTTTTMTADAAAAQGASSGPGAYKAGGAVGGREGCGRESGVRPLPPLPAMPPDYDAQLEEEVSRDI